MGGSLGVSMHKVHIYLVLKCHLRWVGAPPGNMHRPCKVLFDSAGAGGQDAECLFLFYSSNSNTNTKHSTLNLNRNSNKPQHTNTNKHIHSKLTNRQLPSWNLDVPGDCDERTGTQTSLRAKAHVPAARCPWQTAGTDDR